MTRKTGGCGYGCSQRIDYSTVARETGGCGYGCGQCMTRETGGCGQCMTRNTGVVMGVVNA